MFNYQLFRELSIAYGIHSLLTHYTRNPTLTDDFKRFLDEKRDLLARKTEQFSRKLSERQNAQTPIAELQGISEASFSQSLAELKQSIQEIQEIEVIIDSGAGAQERTQPFAEVATMQGKIIYHLWELIENEADFVALCQQAQVDKLREFVFSSLGTLDGSGDILQLDLERESEIQITLANLDLYIQMQNQFNLNLRDGLLHAMNFFSLINYVEQRIGSSEFQEHLSRLGSMVDDLQITNRVLEQIMKFLAIERTVLFKKYFETTEQLEKIEVDLRGDGQRFTHRELWRNLKSEEEKFKNSKKYGAYLGKISSVEERYIFFDQALNNLILPSQQLGRYPLLCKQILGLSNDRERHLQFNPIEKITGFVQQYDAGALQGYSLAQDGLIHLTELAERRVQTAHRRLSRQITNEEQQRTEYKTRESMRKFVENLCEKAVELVKKNNRVSLRHSERKTVKRQYCTQIAEKLKLLRLELAQRSLKGVTLSQRLQELHQEVLDSLKTGDSAQDQLMIDRITKGRCSQVELFIKEMLEKSQEFDNLRPCRLSMVRSSGDLGRDFARFQAGSSGPG